ncbi:hypothetical protein CDL12_18945 [Handroanthus impetiginosus]|uniref:RNase H type-1 domain-containing protein n=1 Tax=Handroanthus impetiginosus TaxID=429701 RepID=A0A2G9GT67_9LAMI|nr:hypothetical protein CDL12_18945 [Handroanthus impetiginosus]
MGSGMNCDTLIWHFSNNGMFSVRSTYYLAIDRKKRITDQSLGSMSQSDFMFLWNQHLPPKNKAFCLASLWFSRNRKYFARQPFDPLEILEFAISYFESFKNVVSVVVMPRLIESAISWCCPPPFFVKVNFDAAIFVNFGSVGLGVITRDEARNCRVWRSMALPFLLASSAAESFVARLACSLAREFKWPFVIVERDCWEVINILKQQSQSLSMLGPVLNDAWNLFDYIREVSFIHIRREANQVARTIARRSLLIQNGSVKGSNVIVDALF